MFFILAGWCNCMTRVVSIVSGKGGVGKTTVAINVGAALAKLFNKRITIVDCNLTTSHLGMALGIHHAPVALNHVLRGEVEVEEALYKHNSGMYVLPSSLKLHEMDGVDLTKLKPLIKKLSEKNDLVILDAGPGLGREALSALHSSQEVVFVATPTLPSVMDIVRYLEFLREHEKKQLGVVINMVQKGESQLTLTQIEKMLGLSIIAAIPRDSAIPRALAAEVPAVLAFPSAPACKELLNVARHVAGLPIQREVKVSAFGAIRAKASELARRVANFPSLD
ncbi:MAG: cell division ATPase MinD [Candidatus Micrarchaeota archaeon]